ncbi:MAG TPA: hypothetical protein PKZ92_00885 [Candidatus Woesebacteria bacterium]|jgi:ComF family protein|nr:ComF family protein [Candidatus Shapirobacteria bacterium]HOR01798.1 hypothetical protein [Candidatus Woesebacteria bacterium]
MDLINLIFPRTCCGCGQLGDYFCPDCLKKIKFNRIKYFSKPPKEGSLSLFRYHSFLRQSIQSLKYEFVTDLAQSLADIFCHRIITDFPHLLSYWQTNHFYLTPIPLYWTRQNWRGFNQSELLAQLISQKLNLKFSSDLLYRHRHTFTQAHLKSYSLRTQNTRHIFTPLLPLPANIILFDDVASSFSTLNSAFDCLKPVGLNRCWYLTLAG